MKPRIILATANEHKLREILPLLRGLPCRFLTRKDFSRPPKIAETGKTFRENAAIKARTVCRLTGLPAIADDSGLVVPALGGLPGVRSARFAGRRKAYPANNRKLLARMRSFRGPKRRARMICAVALAFPSGKSHIQVWTIQKSCAGRIVETPRGRGGFGYDPLFQPAGFRKTFAELTRAQKNRISHRGRAFRAARKILSRLLRNPLHLGTSEEASLRRRRAQFSGRSLAR